MPSAGDDRVTEGRLTDGWRQAALTAFDRALAAGHPAGVTSNAMDLLTAAPTAILAVGKAAASMAEAVRDAGCDAPGIVVTNDESFAEVDGLRCFASAPSARFRGLAAAIEVEDLLHSLTREDHLLQSVVGDRAFPAPSSGITLTQKQLLNEALLASELDIHAMNVGGDCFAAEGRRMARLARQRGSLSSCSRMCRGTGSIHCQWPGGSRSVPLPRPWPVRTIGWMSWISSSISTALRRVLWTAPSPTDPEAGW